MATPQKNTATPNKAAITPQALGGRILEIREQRVLLDSDLADLYEVDTKRLNEQVKRNADRFPVDFMFQLSPIEFADLKSQFATSSWGGKRKLPNAFTEHGAIMAASVLNSKRAVEMSVYVVRAFTSLGERKPDREIQEAGFFPLDALPEATTQSTRARLAEIAGTQKISPHW